MNEPTPNTTPNNKPNNNHHLVWAQVFSNIIGILLHPGYTSNNNATDTEIADIAARIADTAVEYFIKRFQK